MPTSHDIEIRIEAGNWVENFSNWENVCKEAAAAVLAYESLLDKPIELTIILGNDELVQNLNKHYRKRDLPTNVLAFPTNNLHVSPIVPSHLGDVFLAFETCYKELLDNDYITKFSDHVCHLVVHGVLHLLGYQHEDTANAEIMEKMETQILAKLGVKSPYDSVGC